MSSEQSVSVADRWRSVLVQLIALTFLITAPLATSLPADSSFAKNGGHGAIDKCTGGVLTPAKMPPSGPAFTDLEVTGACKVPAGTYYYRNVNIYSTQQGSKANPVPAGGTLTFQDATIDFWANNILVENGGTLRAGAADDGTEPGPMGCSDTVKPLGCTGNTLTIHLYGAEDPNETKGTGIACKEGSQCGVPDGIWNANPMPNPKQKCDKDNLPGGGTNNGVSDCFYQYRPLNYDGGNKNAYFGYKTLGVSFGGSLQLFGAKGASYDVATNQDSSKSGTSWVRLAADLKGVDKGGKPQDTTITLDRAVTGWKMGDEIVITSTDYLPGHTEQLTLSEDATGNTIKVMSPGVQFPHNGTKYTLSSKTGIDRLGIDPKLVASGVENRAAVGLLRRSIRIVSGGNTVNSPFDPDPKNPAIGNYFGAHTVARQGFKLFHVQGVEFNQLGEGGKIGHYPVHFHLARKTAVTTNPTPNQIAFVKDSSVWDSMTRWYVIHGTQDLTLARNIGFMSIGHGYYLEDATEINNKLYSNLGVLARAAVKNAQNPRQIPGIFAADYPPVKPIDPKIPFLPQELVPYHSDVDHPSLFWMTNGWNDFEYNMASGATGCGVCYWFVPAWNSGPSGRQNFESYAAEQSNLDRAGSSPLEKFLGNYCSTAMTSFQTIGNSAACQGIVVSPNDSDRRLMPIHNALEDIPFDQGGIPKLPKSHPKDDPIFTPQQAKDLATYYVNVSGGSRVATLCPAGKSCGAKDVKICAPGAEENCTPTVLDHYTTFFNWADFNLSAVWLRQQWYLIINSVLADIQNGGLTFVTGGGYTDSDEIPGYWALALKDIFIGQTQPSTNIFALAGGPLNPMTNPTTATTIPPALQISCQQRGDKSPQGYCIVGGGTPSDASFDQNQGITFQPSNFGGNQRYFNIYDGPSFEDSNAYLDITKTPVADCTDDGSCGVSAWFNARQTGTARDNTVAGNKNNCYLPNAAIAWKQPNGFYYPPAFHSKNLYFNNVDIRHYVISPLFLDNSFKTDFTKSLTHYCRANSAMFDNFTDVDRQTELDDDDGSLTGFKKTISVNLDTFFTAPVEGIECESGPYKEPLTSTLPPGTVKTSPYDYVTTGVFPKCRARKTGGEECNKGAPTWASDCTNPGCYGVPLYRQYVTNQEKNGPPMPVAIPTPSIRLMGQNLFQRSGLTVNNGSYYIDTSLGADTQTSNIFEKDHTYYTYLLFAKPTTKQTYQFYVGKNDSAFDPKTNVQMVRAQFPSDFDFAEGTWPAQWKRDVSDGGGAGYDPKTGIETVVIDMNGYMGFSTEYNMSKANECAPASFCALTNKVCTCQLNNSDPLFNDCQSVCTNWANRDVKCPNGKCFGFSFKLTKNFETIPKSQPRPQATPVCFPNDIFNISVTNVGEPPAGTCSTAVIPEFQMCN